MTFFQIKSNILMCLIPSLILLQAPPSITRLQLFFVFSSLADHEQYSTKYQLCANYTDNVYFVCKQFHLACDPPKRPILPIVMLYVMINPSNTRPHHHPQFRPKPYANTTWRPGKTGFR